MNGTHGHPTPSPCGRRVVGPVVVVCQQKSVHTSLPKRPSALSWSQTRRSMQARQLRNRFATPPPALCFALFQFWAGGFARWLARRFLGEAPSSPGPGSSGALWLGCSQSARCTERKAQGNGARGGLFLLRSAETAGMIQLIPNS